MSMYVIILVVLVLFSAFFSATETAFSSMNRTRIKTLAEKGNHRAALVYSLSEQYDKLTSTILIGNNIVNIAAASTATVLFCELYGDIGATISTIVVTVVVLIFGEITPKSIAKDCPEKFTMFAGPFMKLLMLLFVPLTALFSQWKKMISGLLKLEPNEQMSQEELLTLVEEVQQNGSIDKAEGTLLHNAIEFSECMAEDILTHRIDLEAVEENASKEEIAMRFQESRYSRLLVYKENIDNIMGVLHQKDFYTGTGITEQGIKDILAPVAFVTLKMRISDILHQMQREKVHVAVVLDGYGGTYGIVTMEDILEELVGEIWDEHDEVSEVFKQVDEKTYRVEASVDLDDFFAFFGMKEETEESSLNGWVSEKLGKVPKEGDRILADAYEITVISTLRHRIMRVEVTCNEEKAII